MFFFSHSQQQDLEHSQKLRFQGSEETSKCCHCQGEEDETIEHFLLSCTKYQTVREELLDQLQHNLKAIGDRGLYTWERFSEGSRATRAQIILGMLSFDTVVDEVINEFRNEYAARAWSDRIVI